MNTHLGPATLEPFGAPSWIQMKVDEGDCRFSQAGSERPVWICLEMARDTADTARHRPGTPGPGYLRPNRRSANGLSSLGFPRQVNSVSNP